jgi:hypothetical protein
MLSKIIVFLVAIMAVNGFTIPDGTSDGVYSVITHENGTEVHTKIDEPSFGPVSPRQPLSMSAKLNRRDSLSCGGAHDLNHADTDAANADIDRQCGPGAFMSPYNDFYAIRNGVVAFVCNFGRNNFCDAGTRGRTSGAITAQCGLYNSGWFEFTGASISYGYDVSWSKFCNKGVNGK